MSFSFSGPTPAAFPSQRSSAADDQRQQAPRKCAVSACLPARSDAGARTYSQPDAAGDGGRARSAGLGLVSSSTGGTPPGEPFPVDAVQNRLKRMRCRILTGARLNVEQVPSWRAAMLTLTYRADVEWEGRHISECIRLIRQWLKRRGIEFRYVWVAEIQEGRKVKQPNFHCVHYHLVVWLPRGIALPMLDVKGWWPHGMTRMEWARCAVAYVSKYVSKGHEGHGLPKGARMYGVGGLEGLALQEARWWSRPAWLRELVAIGQQVFRRIGGGWLDRDTGEIFQSPWRVFFRDCRVWVVRMTSAVSHAKFWTGGTDAALVV